jgi:hypothetical protein
MSDWYDKYLRPHIKTLKTKKTGIGLYVYLADGSWFEIFSHGGSLHLYFRPLNNSKTNILGKDSFTFYTHNGIIGPYLYGWDGTREALRSTGPYACEPSNTDALHYCTALIQYDGWKISDDYPYKF